MNTIYDYMDYRCFLKERFLAIKTKNPLFSYRSFNRLAGGKSSAFLKLVIDGKRNLADEGIQMVVRGFKLNDHERKYFESLVKFNQSRNHEEKDRYFRHLSQNKHFIAAKPLTAAQYHLFSHWFYVAILELVRLETRDVKNVAWVSEHIHPKVGLRDLNRAVKELKHLGLMDETPSGGLIRKEAMLATEDEVSSLSVANFHVQMSGLASRSVIEDEAKDREFSALTVAISERGFQRMKHEIQQFRKKLHSIVEQERDQPKTAVGHLNLQLFKLGGLDAQKPSTNKTADQP